MSFAGCGKLKNSPVSGLNPLNNSTLPETVSQPDISNEVEPSQQSELSQANNPDYLNTPQLPDLSELT
jgi:hypothetical protein